MITRPYHFGLRWVLILSGKCSEFYQIYREFLNNPTDLRNENPTSV